MTLNDTVKHESMDEKGTPLRLGLAFWFTGFLLLVFVPLLNLLPQDSLFYVSDFTLNLFGKYFAFAILALGIDLIWGYTGVLSLGHGVFFGCRH